jgi:hypothetical protein
MNGYHEDLISQLPAYFQAEFPAVLTHRSGMLKKLVHLMGPLFQHGLGPHRFHKIIRVLHKEKYDEMQLQYYTEIKHHKNNNTLSRYFKPTHNGSQNQNFKEFSSFDDKKQYNGCIPSANFISYVYSSYIRKLRKFMDQHTASLDGVVLKGDHSFKIIKHMARLMAIRFFLAYTH